jgi:hypothetical protein
VWEVPDTPRHYGDDFNRRYELWVRRSTGGPADREYRVEHGGEVAWFDAAVIQDRDETPTEVLIDAKGRYAQFLDTGSGEWRPWWGQSEKGLNRMTDTARRQVRVANGRPVEWWCAEEDTAEAFTEAFRLNPMLRGRIRVLHKPMPEQEG